MYMMGKHRQKNLENLGVTRFVSEKPDFYLCGNTDIEFIYRKRIKVNVLCLYTKIYILIFYGLELEYRYNTICD